MTTDSRWLAYFKIHITHRFGWRSNKNSKSTHGTQATRYTHARSHTAMLDHGILLFFRNCEPQLTSAVERLRIWFGAEKSTSLHQLTPSISSSVSMSRWWYGIWMCSVGHLCGWRKIRFGERKCENKRNRTHTHTRQLIGDFRMRIRFAIGKNWL